MTTTRPTRRYLIPTWLLVAIALAGVVGLLLTDPVGAVGATLEDFPPPLPLDELPPTGVDGIAIAANVAAAVLLFGAIAYGLTALSAPVHFLAWLRGGQAGVAAVNARDRARHLDDLRRHGFLVYACPAGDGNAWSRVPGTTTRDLERLHRQISPTCPRV